MSNLVLPNLDDYRETAGNEAVDELKFLADKLKGKRILHVNSTAVGGGVAEILNRMVPLFQELGMDAWWNVVKGGEAFYAVTKKMHNNLHGHGVPLTAADYNVFLSTQEENLKTMKVDADVVFIHDPQPIGLVQKKYELGNHWIWRCHIDVSNPYPEVWNFLKPFIEQYDSAIFSSPLFARSLATPIRIISPSIDPLSEKNRELPQSEVDAIIARLQIPTDKPLVTQVSRFDRLKDPVGVVKAFRLVQKSVNARLLLVGGSADDDPEGAEVLAEVKQEVGEDPDILVKLLPPTSHIEINAIQRASDVIVQKSLREGFGLTITEAMWKGKAVVASAVGGIPLQILHQQTGMLSYSIEDCAQHIQTLLREPGLAKKLGENGREHVRRNFLLTRHLRDYLLLVLSFFKQSNGTSA